MQNVRSILGAVLGLGLSAGLAHAQVTVGSTVRIDTGNSSPQNETTVSVSKANPLEIVAGWNDYRAGGVRSWFGLSQDGGQTWSDFEIRPPAPNQAGTEGDPMTAYDDRTGTLWAGAIAFASNGGVYVARKDPGNASFNTSVMAEVTGGADKCWMDAGPGLAPNTTRVYIAYNEGVLRSADLGDTWQGPVSTGSGIGWLPRVGPNGELHVAAWDFGSTFFLRTSTDGGLTFGPATTIATRMGSWNEFGGFNAFPGDFRVPAIAGLAVDRDNGNLYSVYPDITNTAPNGDNCDVYFTRSVDGGATWSVPFVINGDAATPGDQFFPFIDVDANGRLQVIYYDSRHVVQNDNSFPGWIDTYYAYSDDQGATWTEIRLTPTSWSSLDDGFGSGFIGDYVGISTADGKTFPVYMSTQNGEADIFTNVVDDGLDAPTFYCTPKTSSAGCVATLTTSSPGTQPTSGAGDYAVQTFDAQGFKNGLLFGGNTGPANTPFNGGTLCVNPPNKRGPITGSGGTNPLTCDGSYSTVVNDGTVFPAGLDAGPGNSGWYQYWYRDPDNGVGLLGTALSDAVQLDFQ